VIASTLVRPALTWFTADSTFDFGLNVREDIRSSVAFLGGVVTEVLKVQDISGFPSIALKQVELFTWTAQHPIWFDAMRWGNELCFKR